MIAVIPVGKSRPPTLPYVLRALEANTEVDTVLTVGTRPEGVTPDDHIDSANDQRLRHHNVHAHLRRALETFDVAEFVWIADDIFPLLPWTPGVYVRKESIAGHLRRYSSRGAYTRAIRASVDIMVAQGYDPEETPCGAIHRPWLVDTDRARATVEAVAAKGDGEWKVVYVAGLDGVLPAGDPKIIGNKPVAGNADMVSVEAGSWRRNAGRRVRELFPTPSRWEP